MSPDGIDLVLADITTYRADAIVTPALPDLHVPPFGVATAIMRAAGPKAFEDLARLRDSLPEYDYKGIPVRLDPHGAAVTSGGDLGALIHAVSLDFDGEDLYADRNTIYRSVRNALEKADEHALNHIAIPLLGTGLYALDPKESAQAIYEASISFVKNESHKVDIIAYDESAYERAQQGVVSARLNLI